MSVEFGGREVVDAAHAAVLPVHTHDCHKEIKREVSVITKGFREIVPLGVGSSHLHNLAVFDDGLRQQR